MLSLDTNKFKSHTQDEADWVKSTYEALAKAVEENQLPFKYVRIGRQVKAYGSRGVSSYKNEWVGTKDNIGVWINGHHRNNINVDAVINHMIRSTINWSSIKDATTDEHKTYLKLKFGV